MSNFVDIETADGVVSIHKHVIVDEDRGFYINTLVETTWVSWFTQVNTIKYTSPNVFVFAVFQILR